MRWMILRMIATGSLAAFSAPGLSGVSGSVLPVRTIRPPAAPDAAAPAAPPPVGQGQPARTLPRGSLLDLSV